jgi:hypothetical protein
VINIQFLEPEINKWARYVFISVAAFFVLFAIGYTQNSIELEQLLEPIFSAIAVLYAAQKKSRYCPYHSSSFCHVIGEMAANIGGIYAKFFSSFNHRQQYAPNQSAIRHGNNCGVLQELRSGTDFSSGAKKLSCSKEHLYTRTN